MILKANQKYIDTSSIAHLLVNGEKNADIINLEVDRFYHSIDLSSCDFILRAVNENQNLIDQTLEKSVSDNNIILQWTINEYFTAVDGKLLLEIRAIQGDNLILKYVMSPIYVKSSTTGEGLPSLNTVEKALDDMQELLKQAQDIAVKVPYIDNGTWWVWNIAQNQYVDTGISAQGERGADGQDGENGLSAYEIWLNQGNTGTEIDFFDSLKGEKGDTGECGADGSDGFSPTITVAEDTSNSYILAITDINGSFNTPNLKGADGTSGGTGIAIDEELSETSENPVQNKVITQNLGYVWTDITDIKSTNATLQSQITDLNTLINNLPSSGETITTTLFDSQNYTQYLENFKVKNLQWGDDEYTIEQVNAQNTDFCVETYDYQFRLSTNFGWSAEVQILCLTPVQITPNSRICVNYNCSTTGSDISIGLLPIADFSTESTTFGTIPSLYVNNDSYLSLNIFPNETISSGNYYLKFTYTTVNPVFLIKSIEVIS